MENSTNILSNDHAIRAHRRSDSPIEIGKEPFREIGYRLIDRIADFIDSIEEQKVTPGESPKQLRLLLGSQALPEQGAPPAVLVDKACDLILHHSLLSGHPKFMGYISGSPALIGALADLLASSVNPNVGAQLLSPIATEIEKQTVRWLAEFIGVSPEYGGLLVSGGNMANFTAFLAARRAKAPLSIRKNGISNDDMRLVVYCSKATHTWVEKATVLLGHGSGSIHWIPTVETNQMDVSALERTISEDLRHGFTPFMVIGNAGDVSTGAVDDLSAIGSVCKAHNLWFHIDGAYGIPAAVIPEMKPVFSGIEEADSIAMDPHKWLYSPLEAGCVLVRDPQHLIDAFSFHPAYYNFQNGGKEPYLNYYEYGFQNSRGFRALKVWLILQQVGRNGFIRLIGEDIRLSRLLFELAGDHPELQPVSQNLSIATLRYVPVGIDPDDPKEQEYLNDLNETLLNELQKGGEVFLSHAYVGEKCCLRSCIVNFRTSGKDIREIIDIIVREGRKIHQGMQE